MTLSGAEARAGAWHQSTLRLLVDGCPWRYYLEHVRHLPSPPTWAMLVGTAVHAAVEAHEEARRLWHYTRGRAGNPGGRPIEFMLDVADRSLLKASGSPVHGDPEGERGGVPIDALAQAHNAIRHWHTHIRPYVMPWTPYLVEPYFRIWRADWTSRPLAGWIDQLYRDSEGEWVIVDLKTASSLRSWPPDGAGHRDQATMYSLAAARALNLPPTRPPRFEFHVVRTDSSDNPRFEPARIIVLRPDALDEQGLRQKVELAEDMVAYGDYPPDPSWYLCSARFCPHYEAPGSPCPARPQPPATPADVFAGLTEADSTTDPHR